MKNVPVAVVIENPAPLATDAAAGFLLSPYFDAHIMTSMKEAEKLMLERKVDGIVRLRSNFSRNLSLGDAQAQILVHGADCIGRGAALSGANHTTRGIEGGVIRMNDGNRATFSVRASQARCCFDGSGYRAGGRDGRT